MKDVIIDQVFTGYPDGKTERRFKPDPDGEAIPLPEKFAEMIVEKGHGHWPKAGSAAKASKRRAQPKTEPETEPEPAAIPSAEPEPASVTEGEAA